MTRIVNILHLSDLHYKEANNHDFNVILKALLADLVRLRETQLKPDIVVFSGDFVQAADDHDAFFYFHDKFLEPIGKASGCSLKRFVFTPGNHDVHRSAVSKHLDRLVGTALRLDSNGELNEAYLSGALEDLLAAKFKAYGQYMFVAGLGANCIGNPFFQAYKFDDLGLDFIAANTAWMSWGGLDGRNDLRKLLYPEAAAAAMIEAITPGRPSFLVTHHPLSWLTETSEATFTATCGNTFAAHFFGHMHDPQPVYEATLRGERLSSQAGALYSGRKRYIGYSIVQFELANLNNAAVHLRAYSDIRREFHPAEQLIQGGIFYPTQIARQFWRNIEKAPNIAEVAEWVTNVLLPKAFQELNEGLTDRKLCDVFVSPPLTIEGGFEKGESEDGDLPERKSRKITFDELVNAAENYLVFGNAEYGKTTLLKQAALKLMEGAASGRVTVPIIIDFGQIAPGRDKIHRLLNAALVVEATDWTLSQLLQSGFVTVLIDDAVLLDQERMDILRHFVSKFPRNRYIITATLRETIHSHAVADPGLSVSLQPIFMQQMTRSAMRSLVRKWNGATQQTAAQQTNDTVLRRLLHEMKSINVPITAVNGTIFLTIYETETNFKAINRAVLIENFIEALLDKGAPQSIRRRTFDFTNQKHLLSHIARWMAERDKYVVTEADMQNHIQSYLDNKGLPNSAATILNTLLAARIFIVRPNGAMSFRYRAFLEYFIANQMRIDPAFRDWVMDETRYLTFINEIIYYAGIDRADLALIDVIGVRFEQLQSIVLQQLGWNPSIALLDTFKLPSDDDDSKTMLQDFERQVGLPPLTPEEQDELLEAEMPSDAESRQEVFRPKIQELGQQIFLGLVLYSGLVKNLELIPDIDKRRHLNAVLHAWAVFLIASLQAVPQLATQRRMKINGVNFEVMVPPSFTNTQVARTIFLGMPTAMATLIWHSLGSEKLERQLSQPRLDEQDASGILAFFRACISADLNFRGWWNAMDTFLTRHQNSPYLTQIMVWKMRELHVMGDVPNEGKAVFRRSVAEAFARLLGRDHKDRLRIKAERMKRLTREDLLRRLRVSTSD